MAPMSTSLRSECSERVSISGKSKADTLRGGPRRPHVAYRYSTQANSSLQRDRRGCQCLKDHPMPGGRLLPWRSEHGDMMYRERVGLIGRILERLMDTSRYLRVNTRA